MVKLLKDSKVKVSSKLPLYRLFAEGGLHEIVADFLIKCEKKEPDVKSQLKLNILTVLLSPCQEAIKVALL